MEQETKWEFRALNSRDVFPMMRIISKIGINEFTAVLDHDAVKKAVFSAVDGSASDDSSVVGLTVILEAVNVIAGNLPKCENEIYTLLASTSNLDRDTIMNLGMVDFLEMCVDFVQKEEFRDFIRVASKLLKSEK
jgi:hypothetical protein